MNKNIPQLFLAFQNFPFKEFVCLWKGYINNNF